MRNSFLIILLHGEMSIEKTMVIKTVISYLLGGEQR